MGKSITAPLGMIASGILALFLTSTSAAGTVKVTYENTGTSSNNLGLHELTIDGVSTYAMSGKSKTSKQGKTWTATVNFYTDVQSVAGKFNKRSGHAKKYSQVGYIFGYIDFRDTLSSSVAWNAAINQAAWKIMGKRGKLSSLATSVCNYATRGYSFVDNYNRSNSMTVYTSTDLKSEFYAPMAPIATPIPSAIFLFGSMFIGLIGLVRRSPASQVMPA
ncbi:MAG: hypothetical protein P8P26_03110 [Porticoccaceae bacterium]|nr:hypothetical protein [Porticoccaceae bacterium]